MVEIYTYRLYISGVVFSLSSGVIMLCSEAPFLNYGLKSLLGIEA